MKTGVKETNREKSCMQKTKFKAGLIYAGIMIFLFVFGAGIHAQQVSWTEKTANAAWSPRDTFISLTYNNLMWVIAGPNNNDVWSSANGINWTQVTPAAAFPARGDLSGVVFNNEMWVIAGGENYNDAWYSSDGANWNEATASAAFSGRGYHTSVVYNNAMWVIAGYNGTNSFTDVWWGQ